MVGIMKDSLDECIFNHKVATFARYNFNNKFMYFGLDSGKGIESLKEMIDEVMK
jgi:hypothetical protein